jgi:dipeptidyl aminopeptidase/acylaminoacyl peptidase
MPRLNHARAVALILGACVALTGTPLHAARLVQDGVMLDGVPPPDAKLAAALARYYGGSEARLLDWTSDGALLVARREDGADQLLRLDGDPAHARELGARTPALRAAAVQSYHSDYVATLAAPAATADDPALSIVPLGAASDAAAKSLVEGANLPGAPAWAHDDHRIAFSAALRDPQHRDLYVLDTTASAGPRLIASGDASAWQVLDWTSADRNLLVRHELAGSGDELLLVDVESGGARRVDIGGKDAAPVRIREARLAADDRGLWLIADAADGSSHGRLQYVDLYGNNAAAPLPPDAVRELGHFDLGAGGRLIAYSWNEAGYDRVAVYDRESGRATTVSGLPPGAVDALRFDRAGGRLAIEVAPAVAPRTVYVDELAGGQVARWTSSRLGDVGVGQIVAPLTVRFPTWDRPGGSARTLSALYYRARGAGAHPVLLLLGAHDLRAQYDPFVQYCVNELGFAVVQPELRPGEAGVLDLGALLAWIGVQPDLRRDGVVALGRGAAGTLALEASGLYNDRIRAAVSIDGMASADQLTLVRHPVLLVQGLAEPALDAASAEQLLWRLRTAKIPSGFVAPRDRRPALASAAEQSAAWRVIAQFIAQAGAAPSGG